VVQKFLYFFILIFISNYSLNAQTWREFIDSSMSNQDKQDFQTSLKWAKLALAQAEKEFGIADSNYAATFSRIGDIYYNIENIDSSIFYFDLCVKAYRKIYPNGHPQLASNINNLGYFYQQLGNYSKAEPLLVEALKMQRKFFKDDNLDLASTIINLGYMYMNMARYNESEDLLIEALKMFKRLYPGDNSNVAIALNNLGLLYCNQGKFQKAEPLYIEALEMDKRLYKGPHPDLAMAMDNLAALYQEEGKLQDAEPLFNKALEIRRIIYPNDNPNLASSLNNVASLYLNTGKLQEAEQFFKESLGIFSRLYKDGHPYIEVTLSNLATLNKRMGRYGEAEQLLIQSLNMSKKIFGDNHPDVMRCKNNLAQLYQEGGRLNDAEPLLKEVLANQRKNNQEDNSHLAISISNLASLYKAQGKLEEAEKLFIESLEMSKRLFRGDHEEVAGDLNNLANLYIEQDKFEKSEELLKESLEMTKRIYNDKHHDYASRELDLTSLYNYEGKLKEAEPFFKDGLSVALDITNKNFPYLSEREKNQFWSKYNGWFEEFNSFAIRRMKDNPAILGNMYDNLLETKVLIMNSISKVKRRILNSKDSVLINQYKQWSSIKQQLIKLYSLSNKELNNNNINLDSISEAANRLEKEISKKSESFAESFEKKKITWRTIQAFLKPDEAAVEIVRFRLIKKNKFSDSIYYAALIITDQTTENPEIVILKNGLELEDSAYKSYREKLKLKSGNKDSYDKYWSGIDEKLKGIKKIFLAPDGIYNKLNPATFLKPDGKYLLEEQDIQLCTSTKDIIANVYKSQKESYLLNNAELFGNPDFGLAKERLADLAAKYKPKENIDIAQADFENERGMNLIDLPNTAKEINDIGKFLKSKNWVVHSYLREEAIKSAVIAVKDPRVLHIATHGLFLNDVLSERENPFGIKSERIIENPLLRSGLIFSGASNYIKNNTDIANIDDNGVLTAYEAMNLELDHTELVVLSACETGLGEIRNGEGVYSLQRAFQQAGAKTVLMSLWKVNDEATQELMTTFYSNWVSGMTKREAFSKAQLTVRNKYPSPYYWGAFVMVGE
jgi:CHAT domain-containing protein/tetratricopeptide (TPR) repeat protein